MPRTQRCAAQPTPAVTALTRTGDGRQPGQRFTGREAAVPPRSRSTWSSPMRPAPRRQRARRALRLWPHPRCRRPQHGRQRRRRPTLPSDAAPAVCPSPGRGAGGTSHARGPSPAAWPPSSSYATGAAARPTATRPSGTATTRSRGPRRTHHRGQRSGLLRALQLHQGSSGWRVVGRH